MSAYSFKDIVAALSGPGGNFPLAGDESGIAKEGITIDYTADANILLAGADGFYTHSLVADRTGTVVIRLSKTSTINAALQNMFDYQQASSALWGRNTIVVTDKARGDVITCTGCAFKRSPTTTYAVEAGVVEWTFDAGKITKILGTGTPEK